MKNNRYLSRFEANSSANNSAFYVYDPLNGENALNEITVTGILSQKFIF